MLYIYIMENNKMENKNAIKYINGDIHEVIKTIDDNSIDFIYTDPPFGMG
jgi:predicted methyltransferase